MWDGHDLDQKAARVLDCIGKGAAALSEAGAAVYTMSNAMQKEGLTGLLVQSESQKPISAALQACGRGLPRKQALLTAPSFAPLVTVDAEENRAILSLRLEKAIKVQDIVHVKQLSRKLDQLDARDSQHRDAASMPTGFRIESVPTHALWNMAPAHASMAPLRSVEPGHSTQPFAPDRVQVRTSSIDNVESVPRLPIHAGVHETEPFAPGGVLLLTMRGENVSQGSSRETPIANTRGGDDAIDEYIGLPPLQGVYEVETVLDMRIATDGKREFLIKWRGWGPKWNNWEPEEHILDRRILRKFNSKKRLFTSAGPSAPFDRNDAIILRSKRRCAKHATEKAQKAARMEMAANNGD